MADHTQINTEYLLGKLMESSPVSSGIDLYTYPVYDPRYGHHFPYFNRNSIQAMLLDSRIRYGLALLKGPIITYTKFFTSKEAESPEIHNAIIELNYHFPYSVEADSEDVEKYIIDQLHRFWEFGLAKALTALEWGHSGSEVAYKRGHDGKIHFDKLYLNTDYNLQVVTKNRGIIGYIRNNDKKTYVPIGKGFWHVHGRERHQYYGESALKGAHIPWHETWTLGGARDIRRTWFFKNSYDGGQLYYPEGSYQDANGNKVPYEELAMQLLELKRSGSSMAFPSKMQGVGTNKREWEYEPPKAAQTPQGMEEYIQALRDEELEGLGIPPEVVQTKGSDGIGSSTGRMVPLMAFIASLTPIGANVIGDFSQQILPILLKEYGYKGEYKIRRIVPKTYEAPYDYKNQEPLDADQQFGKKNDGSDPPGSGTPGPNKDPKPAQEKTVQGKNKTP